MGDPWGFLRTPREAPRRRPIGLRLRDWREVHEPMPDDRLRQQAGRCMDCGVPFRHQGCPPGNLIPDWNDGAFVAGDMGRGQSLIVWAIAEDRAAACVDKGRRSPVAFAACVTPWITSGRLAGRTLPAWLTVEMACRRLTERSKPWSGRSML